MKTYIRLALHLGPWIVLLGLIGISLAALPPPPRNAVVTVINGRDYVKGEVYLTGHKDTLLLKRFGFRDFAFDGWALSRVRYTAAWPKSVKLDSLPPEVSGIEYEVREVVPDTADIPQLQDLTTPEDTTEPPPPAKPEGE